MEIVYSCFFYAPRCLIEKKLKTVIENYLNITHKYTLVYYSKIDFKILAKVIQILQVIFINLNFWTKVGAPSGWIKKRLLFFFCLEKAFLIQSATIWWGFYIKVKQWTRHKMFKILYLSFNVSFKPLQHLETPLDVRVAW